MKYTITEDCVSCGECVYNCPQNCITNSYGLRVDTNRCDECKLCMEVCPTDAITIEN
jgi:ferredoxin